MSALEITRHAQVRMAQRSVAESDLDLAMLLGTEVPEGLIVRDKDCDAAIGELRQLIRRIERLRRKRLVCPGRQLVTTYKATREQTKRLLRRAH